jgi:hypothetical protein
MRRLVSKAVLLAVTLAISACQTADNRVTTLPTDTRPKGVDGTWSAVGGSVPNNANFRGGQYTTTDAGNGAVLARGTYRSLGPGQVTLEYTSTVRNLRVAANCNYTSTDMVCVLANGSQYSFKRLS